MKSLRRLVLLVFCALGLSFHRTGAEEPGLRILVFSKTLLYRHASITNGVVMLRHLADDHHFTLDATEESTAFTSENLGRYKVVVFLSTSGDVLNEAQQNALRQFVETGGGLVGIHAAIPGKVATEGDWPWYAEVFCTEFDNHKAIEKATVVVEDRKHPSGSHVPEHWSRTDEWYNFVRSPREQVHVIAALDESSFHGGTMGKDHPVVWSRSVGRGRLWYTALGHTEASYTEPEFVQHVLGGIQFAAESAIPNRK